MPAAPKLIQLNVVDPLWRNGLDLAGLKGSSTGNMSK